jgi:serine/threonine-protein kinase
MTEVARRALPRETTSAVLAAGPAAELRDVPARLGPWRLLGLQGESGLTRVYRARPAEIQGDQAASYAVKVLQRRYEAEPLAVHTLRRELEVARDVVHPRLIRVLTAHLTAPPYYLVMPLLAGRTLQERLTQGPPLSLAGVLAAVRQVAEALDALHAHGWTHGDIKPANALVAPDGHVTVLDLGFARRAGEGTWVDRPLLGSAAYAAPETFTSALAPDSRSDFYSLGVTLYELLAREPPFVASTAGELVRLHKTAPLPDIRRRLPWLPREVVELLHDLLAKEPLRRPQTPRELIRRLIRLELAALTDRRPLWAT